VEQIPISERSLEEEDWERVERQGATCVFLTTPNNPTGWRLEKDTLVRMAEWAGKCGALMCFDTSFRGFDVRTQFDMYRILEDAGVDYIVIEDTGKLWPMSELKLGFIAMSADLEQSIKRIMSDVLLSVSPLVVRLIEELANNNANGGADELHNLIATNRNLVREAVADLAGVTLPDPDARVSVCRLRAGRSTVMSVAGTSLLRADSRCTMT
jgi:aspartate/methionine/tyrosine aminotransferase